MASRDNNDDPAEYHSVTGQTETAEPSDSQPSNSNSQQPSSRQDTQGTSTTHGTQSTQASTQSSLSTAPTPTLRTSSTNTLAPVTTSSTGVSPRTSRTTSPVRKDKQPAAASGNLSTQPSAVAIQRALSASSVQQLSQQYQQPQPSGGTTDSLARRAREPKSGNASGQTTPQWPVSPRLKSPPPAGPGSRRGSTSLAKRSESTAAPSINVSSATPRENAPIESARDNARTDQGLQPQPSLSKAPSSRGPSGKSTLETVQENSSDVIVQPSPAAVQATAELLPPTSRMTDEQKRLSKRPEVERHTQPGESGNESTENRSDGASRSRRTSMNLPASNAPKLKNSGLKANYPQSAKRHSEGKQGMTVETEVVPSIPQSSLVTGDRGTRGESGSVKLKPSNETIRPKKERKKADRKNRSVNQGTAASKADLFEARVASAVDDANTSDSDETFVYESNPPEPPRRQRHHSRTPSATSSHSVADPQRSAMRGFADPFDDRRVGGKRSMKFSSNPYNDADSPETRDGTVRAYTPRHIGRLGRGGYPSSSYDPDSPFTQAQKGRAQHLSAARSRPTSPRSAQSIQYRPTGLFGKKSEQAYDFDAEQVADDERTPLIGTFRGPRGFRGSRSNRASSLNSSTGLVMGQRRWSCSINPCFLVLLAVVLVIGTAIGLVMASNRPLDDLKIHKIHNVLASEQELMFDLLVGAVNPNLVGVSVNDMNINVFAKSKHLGGFDSVAKVEPEGRRIKRRNRPVVSDYNPSPSRDLSGHWHAPEEASGGHDHGTDPPDDEEKETQAMLLGRIFHFDQTLNFEPSPFHAHRDTASGQVRLMEPGNHTEAGGSERWERVIQYPFELIVRGTLKYQLPVSGKTQNAAVGASIMVHPEEGIDSEGNMRTEPVDGREKWQWVEWPVEEDDDDEATTTEFLL